MIRLIRGMSMLFSRQNGTAFLVATILLGVFAYAERAKLLYVVEDVVFALDATSARAVSYGDRHFSAALGNYDIGRAEYFFREAEALDPAYPSVQHQLARVAFLKGDFPDALARITLEIEAHGTENPNAYYVRALVYAFLGKYPEAAADYEEFFNRTPASWGAINDYSWVLLKMDLPEGALAALEWGLAEWPENVWLLNTKAVALYEMGRYEEAAAAGASAAAVLDRVTETDWLTAYPGNDPLSAPEGLSSFRAAVQANRAKIEQRLSEEGAL